MNETQKRNAKRHGLTEREAEALIAEAAVEARQDRQAYREATKEDRDAHDNK
jgi:hypothetical protein